MPVPILDPGEPFPPPSSANPRGLVAITTELTVERLVEGYTLGLFPWFERRGRFYWFSPVLRMVLLPNDLRVSRSLRKTLSHAPVEVRMDTAFREVMRACATVPRPERSTWISPAFLRAYGDLHDRGLAHSVETWREGTLVGGLYGVSIGAAFMGESMFSRESDASKIAFATLVAQIREWGFHFVDCQVYTPHLESLGASEWFRDPFLGLLRAAVREPAEPGPWRIGGPSPIVSRRGTSGEGATE